MAIESIGPAKAAARKAAELAVAEVRAILDRATAERAAALKAGRAEGLAGAPSMRARSARRSSSRSRSGTWAPATCDEVEPLLAELRTEVAPLPDLYREARTQWEATHPTGRARTRRPPALALLRRHGPRRA